MHKCESLVERVRDFQPYSERAINDLISRGENFFFGFYFLTSSGMSLSTACFGSCFAKFFVRENGILIVIVLVAVLLTPG